MLTVPGAQGATMSSRPDRLPDDVVPSAYRIALECDVEAGTFGGTVTIEVDVAVAAETIAMNSLGLGIGRAEVRSGGAVVPATALIDDEREQVVLHLATAIGPGPATIDIAFTGRVADDLLGFYRSRTEIDGEPHWIGVTQFEATHARRAFPCFDEPAFKATFELTITTDAAQRVLSNEAEIAGESLADGRIRHRFATTMIMSTYLVAWVIGPFEVTEPAIAGSTAVRVAHLPGKGDMSSFAQRCGVHAVEFFEDYYGIAYPGSKLDLVAVPDFAFGAMENLGCVTFRETLLLIDTERTSRPEQERAAITIAHEIAHMWFGDLVTMSWWNGIWLNEAFASIMELICADDDRPDWDVWTSFGTAAAEAFETDALGATRAIEFEVATPEDAEAMFDVLTYQKGCSVLRMFEQWAGATRFRDGVRSYLREFSYRNTETEDLWRHLGTATDVEVAPMLNSWILQGGHPLIEVHPTESGVRLTQQRMTFVGGDAAPDQQWIVPVRLAAEVNGTSIEIDLALAEASTDISLGATPTWVHANVGASGFYRVIGAGGFDPFCGLLDRVSQLDPIERFAIVDGAQSLLLAGRITLADAVRAVRAIASVETDASVWRRLASIVSSWVALAPDADAVDALRRLAVEIAAVDRPIEALADALGPDLAAARLRLAGAIGDQPEVIAAATEMVLADHDRSLGGDLSAALTEIAACSGDAALFDRLDERRRDAETPQEEVRLLVALSMFDDPVLVERFCTLCATEVRVQTAPLALAAGMTRRGTGAVVWRFVRDRWDDLGDRFPSPLVTRMLGGIRAFTDDDTVADIARFFENHELPQAPLALAQHLERTRVNAATRRRLTPGFAEALR